MKRFAVRDVAPERELPNHPISLRSAPFTAAMDASLNNNGPDEIAEDATSLLAEEVCGRCPRATEVVAALERAAPFLVETLTFHWSTGQGTRVRHILWSLYTCSHVVNLGDACSGFDRRLAEALAATVAARLILGSEVEHYLREVLQKSGEFARYDREEKLTPEGLPVIYPPAPAEARTFREMADSLDHRTKRWEGSASWE